MKKLTLIALFITNISCAQTVLNAGDLYHMLRDSQINEKNKMYNSGAYESGSMSRIGNSYELTNDSYGQGKEIQVFNPMANHYPDFLKKSIKENDVNINTGTNSNPQYLALKNTPSREFAALAISGFTPGSIQADWDNMWNTIMPGQQMDYWGGTITRFGNQVTYRSPDICHRGCTFSMADKPMTVASNIPSIRAFWEREHSLPLNGDMRGFTGKHDFLGTIPIKQPNITNKLDVFLKNE